MSNSLPPVSERIRPGVRERSLRVTEALLLLLAILVFICGITLSTLTKLSASPHSLQKTNAPPLLNINTASAPQLANILHVPASVGEQIVTRRPKDGFDDVDAIARVKSGKEFLIPRANYSEAKPRLVVRSVATVRKTLFLWAGGLVAFFVVTHLLLRIAHPRADAFLLPVAAFLSFVSVLLLFAIKDPTRDRLSFVSQAQGIVYGGAVALILALSPLFGRAPLHRYGYVYALAAFGGCILLAVAGSGPGGVRLSVAGVQPVEAIKVLLVFFLAAYLAERATLLDDPLRKWGPFPVPRAKDTMPLIVMYALPLALFAIVRDLGPALLLFGVFVIMLYLATGRSVYIWAGMGLVLLGGFIGYRLDIGVFATRLDMWLSPWNNMQQRGDHLALGLWGMASGGPLGSGLGLGGTRFIPRGGSDLALATLGEDMGIAGSLAVLLCNLVIVVRGFAIARHAATDFDRYLAAGLASLFGLQTLLIVSGTLGLFPLSGVTLPFVSFGKSSLIASLFAVGVLLHLSSRVPPGSGALVVLPRPWETSARRVGMFFFATLGLICAGRLVFIHIFAADAIAARTVLVPDRDKQRRAHINPRLLSLAARIKRGRITDRAGKVLATTRPDGVRVYPLGATTGHLIGYLSPAIGGPTGMEKRFDERLRGYKTEASLVGYWRSKDTPGFRLPQGKDVALTLNADLQTAALTALKNVTANLRDKRNGAKKRRGAIVVMDVTTGGVLAAATLPNYDPNDLTPQEMRYLNANLDGDFPLINRAIAGQYPPGSTFKIVSTSAMFAAGLADFTVNCRHIEPNVLWTAGNQTYARRRIVDDEGERPHGLTNLTIAVSESCNVYFARAGLRLGSQTLHDHAARYGLAHLPDLSEFNAALPEIAFGQGEMLATPLEMAGVAQTVANGGKRLAPQWEKTGTTKVADTPLSPEDAARIADMMRRVTITGTAAGRFSDLPFPVAGKTGTAQNDQYDRVSHSWFIGFAPADKPKVAFAVIIENGGYGSQSAVPATRQVLQSLSP
ncbi:MAG: FtsW/RodA/SpoVE family cell cycle protein [Fibrella sp.]|nr:FtsW/RodA/SpoVE family cell cycle protein [Armatimonadota bacterium]